MARKFFLRQGEDETPEYDLTEPTENVHVIWEEIEAGGRAFRGESTTQSIPMRDEQGETGNALDLPGGLTFQSVSRGSTWEWIENYGDPDEVVMARGRVGTKDYSRGRQKASRARELVMQASDANENLQLIMVEDWVRGEETDVARVNALITDYLSGTPRPTTVITNTYVAAGNTVTMPAKTYDGTNPNAILSEIAQMANKNFFVTVDNELWYDTWVSTTYPAGLRISDRPDEWSMDAACGSASMALVVDEAGADPVNFASEFPAWSGDQEERLEGNVSQAIPAGWTLIAFVSTFDDIVNLQDVTVYDEQSNTWTRDAQADRAGDADERIEIWRCNVENALSSGDWIRFALNFGGSASGSIEGDGRCMKVWAVPATLSSPSVGTPASGFNSAPALASTPSGDITFVAVNMHDPDGITGDGDWTDIGTYTSIDAGSGNVAGLWAEYLEPGSGASWNATIDQSRDWVVQAVSYTSTSEGQELATFPPIWDVGPSSTEDGLDSIRCGIRLYYGNDGAYVYLHDATVHDEYWHSEEAYYTSDPVIDDVTKATTLAEAIHDRLKNEERTYNVSIGPLTEDQIGCIKYGQLIYVKARAIPDADDQFQARRIAQLHWTTPRPGMFFARMQLSRPRKEQPYSVGPKTAMEETTKHQTTGTHPAQNITIVDADGNFTATDVEAALDELFDLIGGGATLHVYDPRDYGAAADGTTDDTTAVQDAIDAAEVGGGVVNGGGKTYFISGSPALTVDANSRVVLHNLTLKFGANTVALKWAATAGGTAHGGLIDSVYFWSTSTTGTTGVYLEDQDRVVLRNVRIDDCAVGIDFHPSSDWVEGTSLEDVWVNGCTTGIRFFGSGGTGSFMETSMRNVGVNDSSSIGIDIQADSLMHRCDWHVTVWPGNNAVGVKVDGDMAGFVGRIGFDGGAGGATQTSWEIGANATNLGEMDVWTHFAMTGITHTAVTGAGAAGFKYRLGIDSHWEPVTTNPGGGPELVWDGDEIVMQWVP